MSWTHSNNCVEHGPQEGSAWVRNRGSAMGKDMGFKGRDRTSIASIAKQQLIMEVFGIVTAPLPNGNNL